MTDQEFDLAVAAYLEQMGMALPEQIAQARRLQLEGSASGPPIPLAEALVRCGVLTPLLRENIERTVRARQAAPGQFSQYKLLDKLGEGGMGEVYLAEDSEAKRKVAIKVLPRKYSDDPDFVARFRREAEAATRLKHDNIVGAYATGLELGYCFYVMEFCEGEALDRRLRREGRVPWIQAVRIVLQAARGLHYAHAKGFIHRDIKPANIMLTRSGTAKILDLGLSKRVTERDASFQTASGAVMGTPHYIAPEQANGASVDGRADIYSLGATLYHLVTGTTPYEGTTPIEILYKQVHAQLPNPQDLNEDIPDNLVHVIRKMMAKDPKDRYPDGDACVTDLEEVIAGRVPKSDVLDPAKSAVALLRARPLRKPPTQRREPGPPPGRAVVVAAGLGAAALVLALLFLRNSGPEEKPVAEKAPTPRAPTVEAPAALAPEPPSRPPTLEPWRNGIDLLPLIDPAKDAVAGRWSSEADGLRVDASTRARIEIPYLPCEQYDFRIVFTRLEGNGLTSQLLTLGGQPFNWQMGAAGNTLFAFDRVQFQPLETNPSAQRAERCLETKRRHEATIQVRLNTVTAFLDGRQIARWSSNLKDLSRDPAWRLRDDALLGLGSSETPTIFHSVEVREVFGRGRAMRNPAEAAWRPIFDGRSTDGFHPIRGQWSADSGALLGIGDPTGGAALSTRKEFGDADYRVRFEPKGLTYLECGVRYGPQGSDMVALDRVQLRALEGKTVTLLIRCRGGSAEATVDGEARALGQKAAGTTGPVVLFFRGDSLRLQSLDVREQRPDPSAWQPIFDGRSLDCVAAVSTTWTLNNGALESATPQSFRLVTKREAKDGEWRVVLEARAPAYLMVDSRLSSGGKHRAWIDRPQLAPLDGSRLELLVRWSGEELRTTLNGRAIPVLQAGKTGAGALRIEGQADSLRVLSIEFRPLP